MTSTIPQKSLIRGIKKIDLKQIQKVYPKPFLKWVGGKTQIMEKIKENLPTPEKYNRYFEPFLGGGAVFFKAIPVDKKAVLSDVNENLISAFKDIRDNLTEVEKLLITLETNFLVLTTDIQKKDFYNEARRKYNKARTSDSSVERTSLLIFLNKTCFNGVYRENLKGEFNVPLGRNTIKNILDNKNLKLVSEKLKNTLILTGVYSEVLKEAKTGDLIYLDPPYDPVSKTANFTSYHSSGFGENSQIELSLLFKELDKRGCFVVLSNSDTPLIRKLYQDYRKNITQIRAARSINCKGNLRKPVPEVLIKNF